MFIVVNPRMIIYVGFLIIFIPFAESLCEMPFVDSDTYISASIGTFGANATHFINYPLTIPLANFDHSDFECVEKRDDRYFLKMVKEPNIFNVITKFYMCIELFKVNNHTYYYYLGTAYHPIAQDHLYGDSTGNQGSFDDACNRAYPYEKQTFVMLVKRDAFNDGLLTQRCPDDLLAVFLSFNITSNTQSTSNCDGGRVDVCADRTMIGFSYNNSCPAPVKQLSATGNYSCLFTTTVGSSSYIGLWNQDTTVDETNTFRYSCLAYRKEGSVVYATETPNICQASTTATNPGTNGLSYVIWNIFETCPDIDPVTEEEPVSLAWVYFTIGALLLIPLLIWIICMFVWCYKKYGCICKHMKAPKIKLPKFKKKRLSPRPQTEIDVSRGEKVGRPRFTGPIITAPDFNVSSLFRPKKPVDEFTMLSAIFLEQKPPGVMTIPNIKPLYRDTLDDYMSGGIRRSYTQISMGDAGLFENNNDE